MTTVKYNKSRKMNEIVDLMATGKWVVVSQAMVDRITRHFKKRGIYFRTAVMPDEPGGQRRWAMSFTPGSIPKLSEANEILSEMVDALIEKKWSAKVKTKWSPPEGFFKQPAGKVASGLKSASKDLQQAMSRLNFYINRVGKKLSKGDLARLEKAKDKLQKLYK
jgi:hypothetical protein